MQLGEQIYLLRTAQNLSQGDLAERLDVSRQSISKWENNNAVPDLEKLLKLSEVFGISLDELVKGETPASEPMPVPQAVEPSGHKTAGIIFLALAAFTILLLSVMGSLAAGLLFASPFLVCGVICMVCKRNAGLWCAWAAVIMIDLYLRWATGLQWGTIFRTFQWTYHMNYARLAIAWVQFLVILTLVCVTAVRLKKDRAPQKKQMFIRWGAVVLLTAAIWLLNQLFYQKVMAAGGNIGTMEPFYQFYNITQNLIDWARILAFTDALTETLRHIKRKKI